MRQEAVKISVGDWTKQRLKNMSQRDWLRQSSATNSKMERQIATWKGKKLVDLSNVLHRPPVCHNTGHSVAFPKWLPEFFVLLFTDPQDIVLDPFLGSGATYLVAKRLNRYWY